MCPERADANHLLCCFRVCASIILPRKWCYILAVVGYGGGSGGGGGGVVVRPYYVKYITQAKLEL